MQGRILPNFDESTSRILVDDELIYVYVFDLRVDWDKAFTDYIYNNLGGDALYEVRKYRGWTEDEIRPMKITEEVRAEGKKMIEAGDDHRHRCELHLRVHHQGERQG